MLFLLASETSELYRKLLDANLINSSFSYELFDGPGYCSVIFGGESREPQKAAEMIKDYIVKLKENGIDKEEFEIAKNQFTAIQLHLSILQIQFQIFLPTTIQRQ